MQEINLYDLLKYYARNWLLLLSAVWVGAIIGLVYTNFLQTPLYKSSATLLVVDERTSQDTSINNNYTELFRSRRVLDTVIQNQGYSGDYDLLLARTTASNEKDTDVIRVSIADPNAQSSEKLLAASLESFKTETTEIYGSDNVKVIDAANLPTSAYNVNLPVQTGLAVIACLFFAIIVLFFIYDYQSSQASPVTTAGPAKNPTTTKKSQIKNSNAKTAPTKQKPTLAARTRARLSTVAAPLLKVSK